MAQIDTLFKTMLEAGASDLHLVAGQKPVVRIHGELERLESHRVMVNDELRAMLHEIAPTQKKEDFEKTGDVDFGYELAGMARFRANSSSRNTAAPPSFGRFQRRSCPPSS